ncbi:MAG: RHS repeat protein, partial [Actinomycetia bacterium]|nr:RHS repeat protein [Actinomycetes bacterium]
PQRLATVYTYESLEGDLARRLNRRNNCLSNTDPKGQTWLELTWDDRDGDRRKEEVVSQEWGSGTVELDYDFQARETVVTDRRDNSYTYRFNAAGQTISIEDAVGASSSFVYDAEGLMTRQTLPLGRRTGYVYPETSDRRARGNVSTVEVTPDSRGVNGSSPQLTTTIGYDPIGDNPTTNDPTTPRPYLPTRIVDPRGSVTEIERTPTGLAIRITRAAGQPEESVTEMTYNPFGQPATVKNPNGNLAQYFYFESGTSKGYLREVSVDPSGLDITSRFETDPRGNVTASIDPRGVRHEQDYNALDWRIESQQATTGSSDGAPPLSYRTRYTYDRNGNLAELETPFGDGQSTLERYSYGVLDELLRVERQIMPGGGDWAVDRREYDANLNLIRVTDPMGHVREIDYEVRNLVQTTRNGLGTNALPEPIVESFTYNLDRQMETQVDGRQNTWHTIYDGYGRPLESLDPLGNKSAGKYDDNSNPTVLRSYDGTGTLLAESGSAYDLLNRRTESSEWLLNFDPGNPAPEREELKTKLAYDAASNLTMIEDPLGRVTTRQFDHAERLFEITDAVGNRTELTLDTAGNATRQQTHELDPMGEETLVVHTATFDALGRRTTTSDSLENTYEVRYDARHQPTLVTDPEGYETSHTYDGLDRRTQELKPNGIKVDYEYDKSSRLTGYFDAFGKATRWSYDAVNRQTSVTYPDTHVESYEYDGAHNLRRRVDQNGNTITQGFDLANRLIVRSATSAAGKTLDKETYAYDGLYRLTQTQSGDVFTEQSWDSLSRKVSETTADHEVAYRYDDAGNVIRIRYPSGLVVGREFDDLNRIVKVGPMIDGPPGDPLIIDPAKASTYKFRGPALIHELRRGNGLIAQPEYDDARRLTEWSLAREGEFSVVEETIRWSPRSLKTSVTRNDWNDYTFVTRYDGAERVTQSGFGSCWADQSGECAVTGSLVTNNQVAGSDLLARADSRYDFALDPAQNLTSRQFASRTEEYSINLTPDASGRNRPGMIGDVALKWDANGNLIEKGELRFHYDYRNRLIEVGRQVGDGEETKVAEYEYDAFNRRVGKKVFEGPGAPTDDDTVWAGWQELEHYRGSQLTSQRIFGQGLGEVVSWGFEQNSDGLLDGEWVP